MSAKQQSRAQSQPDARLNVYNVYEAISTRSAARTPRFWLLQIPLSRSKVSANTPAARHKSLIGERSQTFSCESSAPIATTKGGASGNGYTCPKSHGRMRPEEKSDTRVEAMLTPAVPTGRRRASTNGATSRERCSRQCDDHHHDQPIPLIFTRAFQVA